jgi:predicted Zn-dependent protease
MMVRKTLAALALLLLSMQSFSPSASWAQNTVQQGQVSYQAIQTPNQILARLKAANAIPAEIAPQVRVVEDSTLNAATNGQEIMITSGLLKRLKSNDECAFVISHELGHVVLNHIVKTQFRRIGLSLLDTLLMRRAAPHGSLLEVAANLGLDLYDKRSGRVYEYQADDAGIQLMTKAGYNPQAAIEVFRILQSAAPDRQVPEFLQDHPITESRIRMLIQKYKLSS